jgi:hypothetical protein
VIIGRLAVVAAIVLAGACDTPCAFRILTRLELGARRVACCGGTDVQDVVVPDQPDLAIDISQVALMGRVGGQDLWLTKTDCEQLFDGAYAEPGTGPRPTPKCQVLAGPVSPGRVSPRTALLPGRYRVFAQAYSTNPAANDYRVDIGVWGTSCDGSPVSP